VSLLPRVLPGASECRVAARDRGNASLVGDRLSLELELVKNSFAKNHLLMLTLYNNNNSEQNDSSQPIEGIANQSLPPRYSLPQIVLRLPLRMSQR
jgi:hypothetical protein